MLPPCFSAPIYAKNGDISQEKKHQPKSKSILDKVSGLISKGQFADLIQSFLAEKSQLEKRLAQLNKELVTQKTPQGKAEAIAKAQELLALDTISREPVTLLIKKSRSVKKALTPATKRSKLPGNSKSVFLIQRRGALYHPRWRSFCRG